MSYFIRSDQPHYEAALNAAGCAWDVIDSRTREAIKLNDLPQTGLPEKIALEVADLLNCIAALPPTMWN